MFELIPACLNSKVIPAWLNLIATVIGLYFIGRQLRQTKKTSEKQTRPLLGIEFEDAENIRFNGRYFYNNLTKKRVPTPSFKIVNHGGSPAIISGIYRYWKSDSCESDLEPLQLERLKNSDNYKKVHIIVPAHGNSMPLHAKTEQFSEVPRENKKRLFFQGQFRAGEGRLPAEPEGAVIGESF